MSFLDNQRLFKEYAKKECLWGSEPNSFIKKIPSLMSGGNVLDIGVGEGRNALFLAKKGFHVLGVDISEDAIKKYLHFANAQKLEVSGKVLDILNFTFDKKYDVIIAVATLHLIKKEKVVELIKKIKENTKHGGINLLTVFTNKDFGQKEFPDLYFFGENELNVLYGDWEILDYANYTKEESHGKPHAHHICALIAKKPDIKNLNNF